MNSMDEVKIIAVFFFCFVLFCPILQCLSFRIGGSCR